MTCETTRLELSNRATTSVVVTPTSDPGDGTPITFESAGLGIDLSEDTADGSVTFDVSAVSTWSVASNRALTPADTADTSNVTDPSAVSSDRSMPRPADSNVIGVPSPGSLVGVTTTDVVARLLSSSRVVSQVIGCPLKWHCLVQLIPSPATSAIPARSFRHGFRHRLDAGHLGSQLH